MESESIIEVFATGDIIDALGMCSFCLLFTHIDIHLKRIRWFPRTGIYCPQVRTFALHSLLATLLLNDINTLRA